jgi:low affinity Fe/Cu permease
LENSAVNRPLPQRWNPARHRCIYWSESVQTEHGSRLNIFDRIAKRIAHLMGHPAIFAVACLVIVIWGALGPMLGYSDTWQLVINTSTTIVTFLMVFLIQNTQNRDSEALHLKIDELLRAMDAADTGLVDLEERSERELALLHERYKNLAAHPVLKGEVEADASPETASESRVASRRRNQTLRRRIQDPQR